MMDVTVEHMIVVLAGAAVAFGAIGQLLGYLICELLIRSGALKKREIVVRHVLDNEAEGE